MDATWPQELGARHLRVRDPALERVSRGFGYLEADGFPGLALNDRRPFFDGACGVNGKHSPEAACVSY